MTRVSLLVSNCSLTGAEPRFNQYEAQPSSKFKRPRQQAVSRRELGPCRLRRQPRARLPSKDVGPRQSAAQILPRSRGQPLHLCQPSSALLWKKLIFTNDSLLRMRMYLYRPILVSPHFWQTDKARFLKPTPFGLVHLPPAIKIGVSRGLTTRAQRFM